VRVAEPRLAGYLPAAGMSAQLPKSAGNLELYLMYSPAISRVVSRRPPDSNPIIASAARSESGCLASPASSPRIMTRTGVPGIIIRAASDRVLAGTSRVAARSW